MNETFFLKPDRNPARSPARKAQVFDFKSQTCVILSVLSRAKTIKISVCPLFCSVSLVPRDTGSWWTTRFRWESLHISGSLWDLCAVASYLFLLTHVFFFFFLQLHFEMCAVNCGSSLFGCQSSNICKRLKVELLLIKINRSFIDISIILLSYPLSLILIG